MRRNGTLFRTVQFLDSKSIMKIDNPNRKMADIGNSQKQKQIAGTIITVYSNGLLKLNTCITGNLH